MEQAGITVYGAYWCPDCRRRKTFLNDRQIPYRWVNIAEDKEGEAHVLRRNAGKRIIPTIEFADGSLLAEPSNAELARKLGLRTEVPRTFWPLIVAGAGPAGLTAALYAARDAVDALLIENGAVGGQAMRTLAYENVPGFPDGIAGAEFADRLRRQVQRFGGEFLEAAAVTGIRRQAAQHVVVTDSGAEYACHALLLATGSQYRRLEAPGEEDFIGAGVHFCSTCDGPFYQGRRIAAIGGGASAAEEALHLTQFASHVTVLVRGDAFKASPAVAEKLLAADKVSVRFHTVVTAFQGAGGRLRALATYNARSGAAEDLAVEGAFVFVGLAPNTAFLRATPVLTDEWGFVVTGHALAHTPQGLARYGSRAPLMLESSVPGIFAAGDARAGSVKQVAAATGEGAAAALAASAYLKAT